ncbi:ribokinase [Sinomonas gamaensis]|uniref:ribokinase n=1 Tax=Sinomonas gamaensis TaxID=2565624 RepID=UPI001107BE71|nr:ribokinase [Sinomonas gamaensis]
MATRPRPLVILGSINLDLIATAERLPQPGETVGGGVLTRQPGGKGANQAAAAARLDGSSRLVGAVGDDEPAREMLAALTAIGVGTVDVAIREEPTGTALILVDAFGENEIVVCPGANSHVTLDGIHLDHDDLLLCQLEVGVDVVLAASRRHPGFLALNATPAQPLPQELVTRCDLVIVNETEYASMPELAHARLVAVTFGAEGSAIFEQGKLVARVPGEKVDVVNTIGAGDAFCAALVLALRARMSYPDALAVANRVGAHAVTQAASQPVLSPLSHYLTGSVGS